MTELGPEHGKEKILKNNYGINIQKGKADYYFKFLTSQLPGAQRNIVDKRIVWRIPQGIDLNSIPYATGHSETMKNVVVNKKCSSRVALQMTRRVMYRHHRHVGLLDYNYYSFHQDGQFR